MCRTHVCFLGPLFNFSFFLVLIFLRFLYDPKRQDECAIGALSWGELLRYINQYRSVVERFFRLQATSR